MARAQQSGIRLTKEDAAIIKGMLRRGDRQHDIASWFGVNGGRIAEISARRKFADVLIETDNLPPEGPYITGRNSIKIKTVLLDIVNKIHEMRQKQPNDDQYALLSEVNEKLEKVLKSF